jgi:hypothetical protein
VTPEILAPRRAVPKAVACALEVNIILGNCFNCRDVWRMNKGAYKMNTFLREVDIILPGTRFVSEFSSERALHIHSADERVILGYDSMSIVTEVFRNLPPPVSGQRNFWATLTPK